MKTCLVMLAAAAVADAQGVSVLSESANSTTIQVMPVYIGMDTVKTGNNKFAIISFKDAVTEYYSAGSYLKQFIPVIVGTFSRQVQVRVIQTDYRTVSTLPPQRSTYTQEHVGAHQVSAFLVYDEPYEQRNHLASRIKVYPDVYDSTSGTYNILSRIVFQVTSVGNGVVHQASNNDDLLSGTLLNYPQVKDEVVSARIGLEKVLASSVLAQGTWYKLGVTKSGIYKLTYSYLKSAGVPVDNIQLSTIRIFNNGGRELPEDPNASRPVDLIENSIYVYDANGNGKFDPEDYVLFYGKSPRDWEYDPASKTFSHYLNHYTETNYYYLTYGGQTGKRMELVKSAHTSSDYKPVDFPSGIFQEDELSNLLGSGKDWFGTLLQYPTDTSPNSNVVVYVNTLYGLDSTKSVTYTVRLISRSTASNNFGIYENSTGTQFGTIYGGILQYYDDPNAGYYALPLAPVTYTGTGRLPARRSALKIQYNTTSAQASAYVDWYEIKYQRLFQSVNDVLDFYSADSNVTESYSVSAFSGNDIDVFDVTDFSNVSMLQPDSTSNGSVYFGAAASAGAVRQYYAVGPKGFLTVANVAAVENSDLRGETSGADVIIVTAPDFQTQAQQLADLKQSHDGLSAEVVTTTSIYDGFGCGIADPTAIRDYLNFARQNYQIVPSYVILFGGGTYDYKEIASSQQEFVPPYESDESLDQLYSYSTDDYFVEFSTPFQYLVSPISMVIGRLSVRTVDDANAVVDKIREYETKPDYSGWRNLVTFVGDDGPTINGMDDGSQHTDQAETLALYYTPKELDQRKIYLHLYPTVISADGRRKPDATNDIISQVNEGTLVLNFVGHGAYDLWSYTHVLEAPVVVPQLNNLSRLTLVVAATCDFSYDDDPPNTSGAELLVNWAQGGAIGVISSTRVVINTSNAQFNEDLFSHLFARDSLRNPMRIGEAMYLTKQGDHDNNSTKYNYLGDPTVRLALPQYLGTVDSLNSVSLNATAPVPVRALDKLDVKGSVFHPNGTKWNNFSGTALLTIYDSDKQVYVPDWGTTYDFQGAILSRGQVSVENGSFDAKAVVPSDISYSDMNGKIETYFEANGSDGSGYTRNVVIGGTDTSVVNNHEAPQINLYLDSRNFRNGNVVSETPTLIVDLHATNGINLSNVAVGHTLQATFDPGTSEQKSVDLSSFYVGNLNSYQDGTVTYPVTPALSYGDHSVSVRAFDVFNNEADASVDFDVQSSQQLSIVDLYNYPDPFRNGTTFTFQRSAAGGTGAPANVTIKVYTLSGRLIKTIKAFGVTDDFVKIPWDGLDEDGDRLSNGVYFYKVSVSTVDGAFTSEAIGRMAVVR